MNYGLNGNLYSPKTTATNQFSGAMFQRNMNQTSAQNAQGVANLIGTIQKIMAFLG